MAAGCKLKQQPFHNRRVLLGMCGEFGTYCTNTSMRHGYWKFYVAAFTSFLVDDPAANARVIFGRSTANQWIEAWWSILRRSVTNWWMNLFKDLRDLNFYNDGCLIQVQCLKYCFMEVIQSDLNTFMTQWNCHQIRQQRNSELPAGKPDVIYFAPQLFGTRSYELSVVKEDAAHCRILFGKPRSEFSYLEDFETLACEVISSTIQPSDDAMSALRLYFKLLLALAIIT